MSPVPEKRMPAESAPLVREVMRDEVDYQNNGWVKLESYVPANIVFPILAIAKTELEENDPASSPDQSMAPPALSSGMTASNHIVRWCEMSPWDKMHKS